ncbi:hypothetical protein QQA05_00410 [Corynebacterium macclintockiae]|uniref:hypothetical protein n=1 Tax=Corynebacterium macclintockiae TaxID=2913501 RepID=UPI00254B3206|nr:hypothetical protein [Corynebacterium macclintockiae]MDK8889877.1 hypothetical protein [Corynebacterium macclintockiae]
MNANEWLEQITPDSVGIVAKKSGISPRTLHYQIAENKLSVENILKIAVTYNQHPLRALIKTGELAEHWSNAHDIEGALAAATDEQITDEVLRRMKLGSTAYDVPIDELATRRKSNTVQPVEYDPLTAVADSSPDEDALRAQQEGNDFE